MKYILAALVGTVAAMSEIESAFLGYITEFGKQYNTVAEYDHRLRQFAMRHTLIAEENAKDLPYKLGHNNMSDWTDEEWKSILTYDATQHIVEDVHVAEPILTASPVDHRDGDCVSPIQD
jgi:hypothetical protein